MAMDLLGPLHVSELQSAESSAVIRHSPADINVPS